jgi:hypothetical protein
MPGWVCAKKNLNFKSRVFFDRSDHGRPPPPPHFLDKPCSSSVAPLVKLRDVIGRRPSLNRTSGVVSRVGMWRWFVWADDGASKPKWTANTYESKAGIFGMGQWSLCLCIIESRQTHLPLHVLPWGAHRVATIGWASCWRKFSLSSQILDPDRAAGAAGLRSPPDSSPRSLGRPAKRQPLILMLLCTCPHGSACRRVTPSIACLVSTLVP